VYLKTVFLISILFLSACSSNTPPARQTQAPPPEPVRILGFYASPANPAKGEKTLVCYGVENATEVRIDPPVDRVWPSASRCIEVPSSKTVTYTLTAARGAESVSKSITVSIGPPAVKILEVSINKVKVAAGEQVTVCYKVKNATRVTLRPGVPFGPQSPELGCIVDRPLKTTTYTVTATGAGGSVDTEHVTATVQ
jgi:hypothetical protein